MLCHNCPQLCADTMQRTFAQMGMEWTPRERCCGEDFHADLVNQSLSEGPIRAEELRTVKLKTEKQMIKKGRRRDNGHPKRWRPS